VRGKDKNGIRVYKCRYDDRLKPEGEEFTYLSYTGLFIIYYAAMKRELYNVIYESKLNCLLLIDKARPRDRPIYECRFFVGCFVDYKSFAPSEEIVLFKKNRGFHRYTLRGP
jgi:hypothetical protein